MEPRENGAQNKVTGAAQSARVSASPKSGWRYVGARYVGPETGTPIGSPVRTAATRIHQRKPITKTSMEKSAMKPACWKACGGSPRLPRTTRRVLLIRSEIEEKLALR